MDVFPYDVPDLDRSVPFERHDGGVKREWIDWNRHAHSGVMPAALMALAHLSIWARL